MGIPFGFVITILEYFREGEINIISSLFQAVFFGALMCWFLARNQIRSIKEKGIQNLTSKALAVRQTDTIEKDISIQKIHELLQENPKMKNWKIMMNGSNIEGRSKFSWTSWGEKISIQIENKLVQIESKPAIPSTLFDNGRNLENVRMIRKIIELN